MYCNKCGFLSKEGDKFCINCGNSIGNDTTQAINSEPLVSNNNTLSTNETIQTNNSISNVESNSSINNTPNAINNNVNNSPKKTKKWLIVGIAGGISVVILIILIVFLGGFGNPVSGTYDCKEMNYFSGSLSDNYSVTIELNNNKSFTYGPYNDLKNNRISGSYEYKIKEKENDNNVKESYTVTISGNKNAYVINGESHDAEFTAEIEFGFVKTSGKKEATVILDNSYDTYYCYER